MYLLARQEVVSLNPTRTAARTLYGSVSQTRCCEFKSHQKCFENSCLDLLVRWEVVSSNSTRTVMKLVLDLLTRLAIVSLNPTRAAVETLFINLFDKRLWIQIPPELQWKLIMDLLGRWDVVSLISIRTAVKSVMDTGSVSQTRVCEFKSYQSCNENLYGSVSQIRGCEVEFYQNSNENSLWI